MDGSHVLTHGGWSGVIKTGSSTWSSYSLSVSVKPSAWASEYDGVSLAINPRGRYSVYIIGGNQLVVGKWVNGTWTKLAAAPYVFDPSRWYTIKVSLPGGTVSLGTR